MTEESRVIDQANTPGARLVGAVPYPHVPALSPIYAIEMLYVIDLKKEINPIGHCMLRESLHDIVKITTWRTKLSIAKAKAISQPSPLA